MVRAMDLRRARLAGVVVLLSCGWTAWAGLSSKSVERWKAPENRERLKIVWHRLSEDRAEDPDEDPDEETSPAAPADRPLLIYVRGVETRSSARIDRDIFGNTTIALATKLCPAARITTDRAAEVEWLSGLPRFANPMLVVVDRERKVVGVLDEPRHFTPRNCFKLMAEAVDATYERPLAGWSDEYFRILDRTERLLREERKLKALERKAQSKSGDALAAAQQAVDAARSSLETERIEIRRQEADLSAGQRLKSESPEPGGAGPRAKPADLTARERESLAAYRTQASTDNPIERAAALRIFHAHDSPAVARIVLEEARRGDSWTVWEAGRALARMRSPAVLDLLEETLRNGGVRERSAVLRAFAGRDEPRVAPFLAEAASARERTLREAAILAAAAQEDPRAASVLVARLEDRDAGLRTLAARAIGSRGLIRHSNALTDALEDKDRFVRAAAVGSIGALFDTDFVPALIERLAREEGLLKQRIHGTLVRLTAQPLRPDAAAWRTWWKGASAGFDLPDRDAVDRARSDLEKAAAGEGWPGTWIYHGIRTASRRVIFLLDVSSSMGKRVNLPPELSAEQRARLAGHSRLQLAKAELITVLKGLERNVEFNIIPFSGGVEAWRKTPARASHRAAAIRFVESLLPVEQGRLTAKSQRQTAESQRRSGWTGGAAGGRGVVTAPPGREHERNLYGALSSAFGGLGEEPFASPVRPDADTIFLVVDGPPNLGALRELKRIAEVVREINRSRGVTLHVVSFSRETDRMYEGLATENGGRHVIHGRP